MNNVSVNKLKITSIIANTNSSLIMECKYNSKKYCYKEFYGYKKTEGSLNNIKEMCRIGSTDGLIFPEKLVVDDSNKIVGYLTTLLESCVPLSQMHNIPYNDKVELLFETKEKITYLHNKYGIIHADIHENNVCYDKNSTISLIDFDESILDSEEMVFNKRLLMNALEYIAQNDLNYDLDTYLFNRMTFSYLNNINMREIDESIDNGYYGVFSGVSNRQRVLNLREKRKQTEYLIDKI